MSTSFIPKPEQRPSVPVFLWKGFCTGAGFLTRLPIPRRPCVDENGTMPLSTWAWTFPLIGLIVGGLGGAAMWVGELLGLPISVCVVLGLFVCVLVTGALHEDGLADVADGFWGGAEREKKLAIMHDSRIGTFGVIALIMAFALRGGTLIFLGESVNGATALFSVMVMAAVISRAYLPLLLAMLPHARADGLSVSVGRPSVKNALIPAAIGILLTVLLMRGGLQEVLFAAVGVFAIALLAKVHIGGQTGDVAGAAQVVAEIMVLLSLSASWNIIGGIAG